MTILGRIYTLKDIAAEVQISKNLPNLIVTIVEVALEAATGVEVAETHVADGTTMTVSDAETGEVVQRVPLVDTLIGGT